MTSERQSQTAVTASTPMTRDEIIAMFKRRAEAYDDLDARDLAGDYTDDAVIESPISGAHGKAEAERNLQAVFDAFLDLKMRFDPPIIDGPRIAQFATAEGTNMGGLMGLEPSGKPFKLTCAFLFELRGNKIAREIRIYDFTGLLVQVGVLKAKPT